LAAAEDVTSELIAAREEGRLAVRLPLEAIEPGHFARDRIAADDEEMEALKASIAAHGQRMPIDVMAEGDRYALISGWRRLTAVTALRAETGEERFASVLAVVRSPVDAGEAYVAMVEENEIRVGLSYYERARIAALAAERGAFESAEAAVDALYASGSKAKRSKIRAFLGIHEALGEGLRFPQGMSERTGLAVAAGLKAGRGARLISALETPVASAEEEAAVLLAAARPETVSHAKPKAKPAAEKLAKGVEMRAEKGRVTLSGPGVTGELAAKIRGLLKGG